jgi:hypothetical protein
MVSLTSGGLEKASVALTREQWAWLRQESVRDQSRSVSAVLRRIVERERARAEQLVSAAELEASAA